MTRLAMARKLLLPPAIVVALMQLAFVANAQCTGPLSTALDEGLRRALLRYGDLSSDCRSIIDQLVESSPSGPPPTIASDALLARGNSEHPRWYLVSFDASPSEFAALLDRLPSPLLRPRRPRTRAAERRVAGMDCDNSIYGIPCLIIVGDDFDITSPVGEEIHAFPNLQTMLIRVSTNTQFQTLVEIATDLGNVHIMENYPLVPSASTNAPSLGTIRDRIGLSQHPVLGVADGTDIVIAILDSGVDAMELTDILGVPGNTTLGGKIIYEACFSSRELLRHVESDAEADTNDSDSRVYSTPTCTGSDGLDEDWNYVFPGPAFATPNYRPYAVHGGGGQPCHVAGCGHGTRMARIAAGRALFPAEEPGIAPAAKIVSIQIGSIDPGVLCGANDVSPCVGALPIDLLRGLDHLLHLVRERDELDGLTLAAANISWQLNGWCDATVIEEDPTSCDRVDLNTWHTPTYTSPCDNAFARIVDELSAERIHTVVGSGNHAPLGKEEAGHVSLPACVIGAVTVSGANWFPYEWVFDTKTRIYKWTDLMAPGWVSLPERLLAPRSVGERGSSVAAAVTSGMLAIARDAWQYCDSEGYDADLETLKRHSVAANFGVNTAPSWFEWIGALDLSSVPASCPVANATLKIRGPHSR